MSGPDVGERSSDTTQYGDVGGKGQRDNTDMASALWESFATLSRFTALVKDMNKDGDYKLTTHMSCGKFK